MENNFLNYPKDFTGFHIKIKTPLAGYTLVKKEQKTMSLSLLFVLEQSFLNFVERILIDCIIVLNSAPVLHDSLAWPRHPSPLPAWLCDLLWPVTNG